MGNARARRCHSAWGSVQRLALPDFPDLFLGKQGGAFDESAEFLFTDPMVGAFTGEQVRDFLILNLQSLKVNDA